MSSYTKKWYEDQRFSVKGSAQVIVPIVLDIFKIRSIVDVGCGDGTWLSVWGSFGINDYLGIDGDWIDEDALQIPKSRFKRQDLSKSFSLDRKYDMAVSLEVAEHIPENCAEIFVDNLVTISSNILFSAAIPFQGGTDHVNEQWQSYWAELFMKRGFIPMDIIRPKVWQNKEVGKWYKQNIIVYNYQGSHKSYEDFDKSCLQNLNCVHPEVYLKTRKKAIEEVNFPTFIRKVFKNL